MKLVVFYHCYLFGGNPPTLQPNCLAVVTEQMKRLQDSGLADAADEMIYGINGGTESLVAALSLMPPKAELVLHSLHCHNENLTIVEIEKWVRAHAEEAYILFFHAKGSSHGPGPVLEMRTRWRDCMERHLITNWRQCVADLDTGGFDAVGCHWMEPPATPPTQYIFGGNFFWARASFLRTLPSIMERARIKQSGIGNIESRYEAEVWIGNGPRPPRVRDYHGPGWNPSKVDTCA